MFGLHDTLPTLSAPLGSWRSPPSGELALSAFWVAGALHPWVAGALRLLGSWRSPPPGELALSTPWVAGALHPLGSWRSPPPGELARSVRTVSTFWVLISSLAVLKIKG